MENLSNRRVVITGVGVVSPLGLDARKMLAALRRGESGIAPLTLIPQDVFCFNAGGESTEFTGDISNYGELDKKLQRTIRKGSKMMCREIEFGVAAAQHALLDARLSEDQRDPDRTGVTYGCDYIMSPPTELTKAVSQCLTDTGEFDFKKWGSHGISEINPLWLLKYLPNMPASHVAIYNDLRGPNNSITMREASAGAAITEAYSTITRGHADVLIVGSTGSGFIRCDRCTHRMQETVGDDRDDPDNDVSSFRRVARRQRAG